MYPEKTHRHVAKPLTNVITNLMVTGTDCTGSCIQDRQENFWAPGQKETWPPSSNSPNNDTQTKSTTVCHKQGRISTTKMN